MGKFYAAFGWVVLLSLLVATGFAYRAPDFEQAMVVLWLAQVPLYAYITVGIVLLVRAQRHPVEVPSRERTIEF